MMIRLFFAAAVSIVSVASATVPALEIGHDPSRPVTRANFTFYSNAQPTEGAVPNLFFIAPFMHSACGTYHIDFMSVYAGNSNITSDGKYECLGGEENCLWLKTMNCIGDTWNADIDKDITIQQIMLYDSLIGRGPGQLVWEKKISDCLKDEDLVADLFGGAIKKTQKAAIDWSKEIFPIALTINGVQTPAWHSQLFKRACELTNSPHCCVPDMESTFSKHATVSKLLKKPKAPGAIHKLASTSLKAVSTTPATPKANITVYFNGDNGFTGLWLTEGLVNGLYSPCAEEINWNIVQAGETNETSPGHFTCKPDACKWLEGMNCIASYLPESPLLKAQELVALSVLAHGTVDNLLANISPDLGAKMKSCIADGTGKRLLSEAVKETQKLPDLNHFDTPWSVINGKEVSAWWDDKTFDVLCKATGKKVCCDRKFPPKGLRKDPRQIMKKVSLPFEEPSQG